MAFYIFYGAYTVFKSDFTVSANDSFLKCRRGLDFLALPSLGCNKADGFSELLQVFDDEDEALLEDSAPPVDTKVSALRDAVFCTAACSWAHNKINNAQNLP